MTTPATGTAMLESCHFDRPFLEITEFESDFVVELPEAYEAVRSAPLVVHPDVSRVVIHGSRGPSCTWRTDSDLDLSLVMAGSVSPDDNAAIARLAAVLGVTTRHWCSPVTLDAAVVFDVRGCALRCFSRGAACEEGGADCFAVYKDGEDSIGTVHTSGLRVERMLPCLTVWRKR